MRQTRFRDGPDDYQYGDDQEEGGDGYVAVEHRALIDDDPDGQPQATSHPAARGGGGAPRPSLRNYRTDSSGKPGKSGNALGESGRVLTDGNAAASAANDGHGLATSLLQSIRHHARLIDGEGAMRARAQQATAGEGGPGALLPVPVPVYDPYADDDHVSLAPAVEMSYGPESAKAKTTGAPGGKKGPDVVTPALRDFVANAAAAAGTDGADGAPKVDGTSGHGTTSDTHERQTERLKDFDLGARFNVSNWYDAGEDEAAEARSVRLDGEAFAAAIARGDPAAIPTGPGGRAPKFLAPPPAMFRTATRHPSHLPPEYDDVEGRLDAPRLLLAARKRHRRNDSFLRLVIAVLCLGLSLAFAVLYGEGRFGMAITTLAYDRKVVNRYGSDYALGGRGSSSGAVPFHGGGEHGAGYPDYASGEKGMVYPDWWESQSKIPDMALKKVRFAPNLENRAAERDDRELWDDRERVETPFFWFVPRSGGNVIRTVMSRCLRLTEASELGAGSGEPFLRVMERDDRRFVNVDMTNAEGLKRAEELNLASSGVADVVISPDVHGVLNIYNAVNRARMFALLRHPLERAISKYHADVASDRDLAGISLTRYVREGGAGRVENNYLTRHLSGRYGGKLSLHHLDLARELLRRKFVVGIADDLPGSARLFGTYFGWWDGTADAALAAEDCVGNIFGALSDRSRPSVEEGSEGWKLLMAQNWFDLRLYEYAEHLFRSQVDQLKLGRKDGEVW